MAFPIQDVGPDDLGRGVALDGTFRYRFTPQVGAYAGWGWAHFNPETSFAGNDIDFEETGYVFGLRFEQPFSDDAPVSAWLSVGGTVVHLEWSLTPGVRYSLVSRDVEIGPVTTDVELEYVAVDIGLRWSF